MKNYFSQLYIIIFSVISANIFSSCATAEIPTRELLIGDWNAEWRSENKIPIVEHATSTMQGKISFNSNGSVEMYGYGYKGCLFANDTMYNQLKWTIQNDTLMFINKDDHFIMNYNVHHINENVIELKMMDDIMLILHK